ncbi:MAG TPA: thiamine diphosphokinase [Chloroflexia bacterium]|nr:thiamine diphosphokinase [Chloroflexia bacterium]
MPDIKVKCVWVLASAPHADPRLSLRWAPVADRVVAADGGMFLASRLGITPDVVVGDLDSYDPALVDDLLASGVEVRRYQHHLKMETDTELAMLVALEWQPETVILMGGIGGRLDHSLANILLLTHPQLAPVDVRIIDGNQQVSLAKRGRWNDIAGDVGDTVTLLPVGDGAQGVRTEGLHWPLYGETLPPGRGRGVSNLIDEPGARVWVEAGQLLIVVLHEVD